MNLVCFINGAPGEVYLANRLHDAFGLSLLVRPEWPSLPARFVARVREQGLVPALDTVYARLVQRGSERRRAAAYDRWLGNGWKELHPEIPELEVPSLNDQAVVGRLASLGEVTLVVHASTIVRPSVLNECVRTLNVHWGLSPYYRGTRCTEWALLHWDVQNIGVTVHELSAHVDAGAIIGQARADVIDGDSVDSVNTQLTALGTGIVLEALEIVRDGGEVARTPQEPSLGLVSYKRQWSRHLSRHIRHLERRGLRELLETPSRDPLPIVALTAR